ncbi:MAG: hypothetical protein WCG93_09400 [Paludibacter sp.]
MTTKKIILAFVILFTNMTFAQQKVAVYVTGGTDAGINKVLGDKLVEAFVKSGNYTAVERSSSFLDELSKEKTQQSTDNIKNSELSRLGRQFGVQLVCVAEVSDVLGEKYVSARLIDVESSEVLTTSNSGSASIKSMSDLISLSEKLSYELSGKTGKEQHAEQLQRSSDEKAAAKTAEDAHKKQQQQDELGNSIVELAKGVATLLGGTIVLENHDKDPFYVYINDKYIGTVSGFSTMQQKVQQGYYTIKIVEKSGYVLHQQIETFNVKINKGDTRTCKWD